MFREFFSWIINGNKLFVVIAHQNVVKYNTIFPYIRDNRIWLGNGFSGGATHFFSPYQDTATAGHHINGMIRVSGVVWLTNIEHGKRHEPLKLMSEKDNIKYSRHKEIKGIGYLQYDNLDAIEVPFSDAIPNDYMKLMGVPITFLDKYCPEQFEIIGIFDDKREDLDIFIKGTPTYVDEQHKRYVGPVVQGKALYSRILIRKK